ncbi:MAG TPA: HrpB1 family type III secretion system apparatus protein [Burkholderiaceae bacterium]
MSCDPSIPGDSLRQQVIDLANAMMSALQANDLEGAACNLESLRVLTGRAPDDADVLLFRVLIAVQRGQAREALHYLNDLGEEHPELRALCLYSLREPYWEGLARRVAEDPAASQRPGAAYAMQRMLDCHAATAEWVH